MLKTFIYEYLLQFYWFHNSLQSSRCHDYIRSCGRRLVLSIMDNTQEDCTSSTSNILEDILDFFDFILAKGATIDENASLMTLETRIGFGLDMEYSINMSLLNSDALKNGANTKVATAKGENPLHSTALTARLNIVKTLLQIGFDPNSVNFYLETPFHSLFSRPQGDEALNVVKALIEAGVDINAKDANGKTPLEYAYKRASLRKVFKYFKKSSINRMVTFICKKYPFMVIAIMLCLLFGYFRAPRSLNSYPYHELDPL